MFDYHTSTLYTLPFKAVCIEQILPKSRTLAEFCPVVREAFLAFFTGHRAAAIAALVPIVEGALTRIVERDGHDSLPVAERVNKAAAGAIARAASVYFDGMWVPKEYATSDYLFPLDERVLIFETLRRWLVDSFFGRTADYKGATWLNRNLFAHALSSSWQQTANFSRLVVALAVLALLESWYDGSRGVSVLFPEMNADSHLLWQRALFQANVQHTLQRIAEKSYHEHGRMVPEMPTDDGALLRRALLSEDCIKDLVRPLRDAGWSVAVGEPEKTGLYVTVEATSGVERVRVALLYSCATANETYRALAATADVILYRGAPYHQDQYAYGIGVHVGPVSGWQPPRAPPPESQ